MAASKPILIAGPTASGKSALALAIAERVNGTIINADSMQVYSDLRVLTARPTPDDEALLPHQLYGHVPARDAYSVGRFVEEASAAIQSVNRAGRRAIVVGGTGLYFKGLLAGLSPIPPVAPDVRAHWRSEALRLGATAMHEILRARDAQSADRLHSSDTQRIVRALEVLDSSGRSLAYWQSLPAVPVVAPEGAVKLLVTAPREELHARAGRRFAQMLAHGALEEVRALAALNLNPALPAMRALGVRPLLRHLEGEVPLEVAAEAALAETRQYIKRQETWFRQNMIAWTPVPAQEIERICRDIVSFIDC